MKPPAEKLGHLKAKFFLPPSRSCIPWFLLYSGHQKQADESRLCWKERDTPGRHAQSKIHRGCLRGCLPQNQWKLEKSKMHSKGELHVYIVRAISPTFICERERHFFFFLLCFPLFMNENKLKCTPLLKPRKRTACVCMAWNARTAPCWRITPLVTGSPSPWKWGSNKGQGHCSASLLVSQVVHLSGSRCPFQFSSTSRPCHFHWAALKLGQAALSLKFPTNTALSIPKWFSRPGQSLRKPEEPRGLPWQPPTQKGKEDKPAKLAAWGSGVGGGGWGESSFGVWSQTGMHGAYRIAQRSRELGVFESRSERKVWRGQCHSASPGLPRDVKIQGWLSVPQTPPPHLNPHLLGVCHGCNTSAKQFLPNKRMRQERDPVRGTRPPPLGEVQCFVESASSTVVCFLSVFVFSSPALSLST